MQYSENQLGRLFTLRFDHEDPFLEELKSFIQTESIEHAILVFMGALKEGRMVTGPQEPVLPPIPNWTTFQDGWEVVGMGTIFPSDEGPKIHIHSATGKDEKSFIGCIRDKAKVFLTIEAVVLEMKNLPAKKALDPKTGLHLLTFDKEN